jgi:uncharacterized protein YebE (UPF0316 family)
MALFLDLFLIFFLRLLDVGMATVRIVLLGKGRKGTATALGFVEALIWVIAVIRVLDGLDDPLRMVAFAAGFAAGTYLGAPVASDPVAPALRKEGFGATVINGSGLEGDVRITFCVLPRKRVPGVTGLIKQINPEAFVTVDSTNSVDLFHRQERTVRR